MKVQKSVKETGFLQLPHKVESIETDKSGTCTPLCVDIGRKSSMSKLLRVTAPVLRFINKLRHKCKINGVIDTTWFIVYCDGVLRCKGRIEHADQAESALAKARNIYTLSD